MKEQNDAPMLRIRKTTKSYIMAAYLGFLSAFFILIAEFFLENYTEFVVIGLWVLLFYPPCGFFLGKITGPRGTLIGLVLAIPLAAVTYWIPEALAYSTLDDGSYLAIIPIVAFIVGTLGQIFGQKKARRETLDPFGINH